MRGNIRILSKKLHRRKRIIKAISFFLICATLFAGVVAFFYIPFLKVKKIIIEGDNLISAEVLTDKINQRLKGKYYGIFPRDNIFIVPQKNIKKDIFSDLARVKNIQIDKKLFSRNLAINIVERQSAGILCQAENCFFVDEDGFIFEEAPYFSGNLYLRFSDERTASSSGVIIGEFVLPAEEFKKLLDFKELASRISVSISEVVLKKENIYELYTLEGWRVLANNQNNPNDLFINLAATLDEVGVKRQNLDYVDLRFGRKVFYKFK